MPARRAAGPGHVAKTYRGPGSIFANAADGEAMADRHGISGIPRCILIDRDGVVISASARREWLGALLAERGPEDPPSS